MRYHEDLIPTMGSGPLQHQTKWKLLLVSKGFGDPSGPSVVHPLLPCLPIKMQSMLPTRLPLTGPHGPQKALERLGLREPIAPKPWK